MDKQKYYITTAIAYTSGKPHIGNTYEVVLADAIARYKRQEGYDVFFQTGTILLRRRVLPVLPLLFVPASRSETLSGAIPDCCIENLIILFMLCPDTLPL